MRRLKPNRRLLIGLGAVGVAGILVAAAVRPNFFQRRPASTPPRTVMLSELYQAVVDDARAGFRDTVTIEGERVVASTTAGPRAAWTGGSDTVQQLRDSLKDAGLNPSEVAIQFQQPPSQASRL